MNLRQYKEEACNRLDRAAFDYFAGGALDERALAANEAACGKRHLHHRILRAAVEPDFVMKLLGRALAMRAVIVPVAFQRMAHFEGKAATARAAAAAETAMILSTTSNCSVAAVGEAAAGRAGSGLRSG